MALAPPRGLLQVGLEAFPRAVVERAERVVGRPLGQQIALEDDLLAGEGLDREQLLAQSLLAPARCCLVNPDRTKTVVLAYAWLREMSHRLREKYGLE